MVNQLKSCKRYWKNLSKLEERLIKEGYLELGYVKHDTNQEESERIPFLTSTTKFDDMMKVLISLKGKDRLVEEKDIIKYINNPDKHKDYLKKLKKQY